MLIYNFVRPYNHLHYGVSSITESFFCVDKWTSRGGAISKKNGAFLNLFKSFKVIPKELFGLNNPNLLFSILARWYLSGGDDVWVLIYFGIWGTWSIFDF